MISTNVVRTLDAFVRKVRDGTSEIFLEGADATVKYVMVIVDRTAQKSTEPTPPEDRYIGFTANSNETLVTAYMACWGIETCFRMIKDVSLRTCSTKLGEIMLCFTAFMIIFNQWVVINAQHGFDSDGNWQGIEFTMQSQIVTGNYDKIMLKGDVPSDYQGILKAGETETRLDHVRVQTNIHSFHISGSMKTEAVYVVKTDGGEENLIYNSNMMKIDKEYIIEWHGEHYMFIKRYNKIEFYKFHPNKIEN